MHVKAALKHLSTAKGGNLKHSQRAVIPLRILWNEQFSLKLPNVRKAINQSLVCYLKVIAPKPGDLLGYYIHCM